MKTIKFENYKNFLNWLRENNPSLLDNIDIEINGYLYENPLSVIEHYNNK